MTDPTEASQEHIPFSLDEYERRLADNGLRTGRAASEAASPVAPQHEEIRQATNAIRTKLAPMFEVSVESHDYYEGGLEAMKNRYWQRASRVGHEHGAVAGFEFDDYFETGDYRSYYAIRQELADRNAEGTLGRRLLDTVDLYHKSLEINPALAATIVSELISKGRGTIGDLSAQASDLSPTVATEQAFDTFLTTVTPQHIAAIVEKHGTGEPIVAAMTKRSFYPEFEDVESSVPLQISPEDARAFIDVLDIQNRPYSRAELRMANELSHVPNMQMAMLGVHERLMEMSETYLKMHPERITGNMSSWSEIFIAETHEDGTVELLPNPKLMRAITNNVLPAIAGKLLERGVDIDQVTFEDIQEGVEVASKRYKLLQAKIGLFKSSGTPGLIELGDIATVVCPANQLFPRYLAEYLGSDYASLEGLEQLS